MNLNHIEVNVTQAEIDGGEHLKICACPLSNTINRSLEPPEFFPRLTNASVHLKDGHVTLEE